MAGCAVVTGASRGIGAATAKWLACGRVGVVLAARDSRRLEQMVTEIEVDGGAALAVPVDVTKTDAPARVLDQALQRFGEVVALVNNAGVIDPIGTVAATDTAAWRQAFEVNFFAALSFCEAALPHLRDTRGRLVNVGTALVDHPLEGLGAYTASKAALANLTRVLTLEEPEVIACGYIPGPVDTGMFDRLRAAEGAGVPQATVDRFRTMHAEGTLNQPDQAGRAVAWLALHAGPAERGRMVSWQAPGLARRVSAFPQRGPD